jgi:hypothetical protein
VTGRGANHLILASKGGVGANLNDTKNWWSIVDSLREPGVIIPGGGTVTARLLLSPAYIDVRGAKPPTHTPTHTHTSHTHTTHSLKSPVLTHARSLPLSPAPDDIFSFEFSSETESGNI